MAGRAANREEGKHLGVPVLNEVGLLYKEMLGEVLELEERKKELASLILRQREPRRRQRDIREFIQSDLSKHEILSRAMVAGIVARDEKVLADVGRLYGSGSQDETWKRIKDLIALDERMIEILDKEIKYPGSSTFMERRLLMEIDKQMLAQAREYVKVK